ncbi:DUF5819 family protein [Streptomyces sp. NPDC021749]|uniref:Uncharacterized protein n=1 Tax=Streptomyces siderophoricus TaxID=2802281 RepID=A0ABS1MZ18_9ACTN|nr:DUF5819 family protein [Streptomyces sp. 9-7]MBL1092969.1 hypothetical protein [Streptomyces sp. 9-7]
MIIPVRRARTSGPPHSLARKASGTVEDSSPESAPLAQWNRTRRRALLAVGAAVPLALSFHFGMTALYEMPFNPVKEKYGEEITSYIFPYFVQDWHLFAPDPIAKDRGVLVRAKKRQPDGSTATTQWTDVTSPVLQQLYGERFWPSREIRVATGLPQLLESWRDPELEKLRNKNQVSDRPGKGVKTGKKEKEDPPLSEGEKDSRDEAIRFAQSFASTQASKLWGPDVEYVQVRIVTNEFPRFSQRYARDAKGKVSYYDLAWMKPVKVER